MVDDGFDSVGSSHFDPNYNALEKAAENEKIEGITGLTGHKGNAVEPSNMRKQGARLWMQMEKESPAFKESNVLGETQSEVEKIKQFESNVEVSSNTNELGVFTKQSAILMLAKAKK